MPLERDGPGRQVTYATASASAMAALVAERYGLRGALRCSLLNRGFNDTYLLTTGTDARYVLRLSGHRARGPADVAAETDFLAYLDGAGVPVAAAVPTREGALFTAAEMPDGLRPVVLFHHLDGRRPELDDPSDAWVQGAALARVHEAGFAFPGRESGRYRLDLDHLMHRQVEAVLALDIDAAEAKRDLSAIAERLADRVGLVDRDLTRVRCYGDCQGFNARIAVAGPRVGQAALFDFDDGGFGYLSYDLSVHLWAQVSFGRRRHPMWHAFQQGYQSIRRISSADEAAVLAFVPIRHIWLMGEYAGRTNEWGQEALSAAWLKREVQFLLTWEQAKLSDRLL